MRIKKNILYIYSKAMDEKGKKSIYKKKQPSLYIRFTTALTTLTITKEKPY